MRLAITGGGTGGHIYPGLAIADAFPEVEILFIGQKEGLEARLVPAAGYNMAVIKAATLPRRIGFRLLPSGGRNILGLTQAFGIIRRFQPHAVIGTGGYVAGPAMMAAVLLKKRTLLHEQNAYPSLTNRLLAPYVNTVCLSFTGSEKHFKKGNKFVLTGNPVRPAIVNYARLQARNEMGLNTNDRFVLVVGGSQGARTINKGMVDWLSGDDPLPNNLHILHVTGGKGFAETVAEYHRQGIDPRVQGNIKIEEYLDRIEVAYAAADLVVARSGAMSLAEITARGLPSILIPYPFAADEHQLANARALTDRGAAFLLTDDDVKKGALGPTIMELIMDKERLGAVKEAAGKLGQPRAVELIKQEVEKLLHDSK